MSNGSTQVRHQHSRQEWGDSLVPGVTGVPTRDILVLYRSTSSLSVQFSLMHDSPKRFQHGFLGLRYPSHTSDIHALIRPVTSQCSYAFACLHIPELNCSILAAAGDGFSVGTTNN